MWRGRREAGSSVLLHHKPASFTIQADFFALPVLFPFFLIFLPLRWFLLALSLRCGGVDVAYKLMLFGMSRLC